MLAWTFKLFSTAILDILRRQKLQRRPSMYWKRLWKLLQMVMVSEESEDSEYDSEKEEMFTDGLHYSLDR